MASTLELGSHIGRLSRSHPTPPPTLATPLEVAIIHFLIYCPGTVVNQPEQKRDHTSQQVPDIREETRLRGEPAEGCLEMNRAKYTRRIHEN